MHISTLNIFREFSLMFSDAMNRISTINFFRQCIIRYFCVILPRCFDEGVATATSVRETGVNPVQLPLL